MLVACMWSLVHFIALAAASTLTFSVPPHIPALPSSATAVITGNGTSISAPVTRQNSFIFTLPLIASTDPSLSELSTSKITTGYLLIVYCRDYDFPPYTIKATPASYTVYRTTRAGLDAGFPHTVVDTSADVTIALTVLKVREYYDARAGFSPLSLLKNPMVLIGVVGLAFVMGMPYLLDNMDPETKAEFEAQQKKSILGNAGAGGNPLGDFDMAGWMAGTGMSKSSGNDGGGGGTRKRG